MARGTLWFVGLIVQVASCATGAGRGPWSPSDRQLRLLLDSLDGGPLVLRSAVFSGSFFGEAALRLVDPRPSEIIALFNQAGERLPTPPLNGEILPAGTPVRLTELQLPNERADDDAGAALPTAHPWLVVQTLGQNGGGLTLVFVLPRELESLEQLRAHLLERVATRHDLSRWMNARSPEALRNIQDKTLAVGLTQAEMLAALGRPRGAGCTRGARAGECVVDYGRWRAVLAGETIREVIDVGRESAARRTELTAAHQRADEVQPPRHKATRAPGPSYRRAVANLECAQRAERAALAALAASHGPKRRARAEGRLAVVRMRLERARAELQAEQHDLEPTPAAEDAQVEPPIDERLFAPSARARVGRLAADSPELVGNYPSLAAGSAAVR